MEIKLEQYAGEAKHRKTLLTVKYNPYEDAIIISDDDNKVQDEIWIEPVSFDEMLKDLTNFRDALNKLGVATNEDEHDNTTKTRS